MKPNVIAAYRHEDPAGKEKAIFQPYSSLDKNFLEFLAAQGDLGAMEEVAECCYYGDGREPDLPKARTLLERGAEAGNQDAMFILAESYRTGTGVKQSYEDYFVWLEKAANAGSWQAAKNMATAYFHGKERYDGFGFDQDDSKALEWSIKAAELTHYIWHVYAQPDFQGFDEMKDGLVDQFASSVDVIARHYQTGRGVEKDRKKAIEWLKRGNQLVREATGGRSYDYFDARIEALKKESKDS